MVEQHEPLEAHSSMDDDAAVIAVSGELDVSTASVLEREIDALVAKGASLVYVDAAGLRFVDSSGIAVLVGAQRRLSSGGGAVMIRNAPPVVRRVLEVSGVDKVITIVSDAVFE